MSISFGARRAPRGAALLTIICGIASFNAAADDDSISTDRPDFVDSPDVVAAGHLQFESGIGYTRDDRADPQSRVFNAPVLARYGLLSNVELRLATDGPIEQRIPGGATERGFSDLTFGMKWHAGDGTPSSLRPALAIELQADLPSGSSAFKGEGVRPAVRGIAEWEFADTASLGVMTGAVYDRSAGRRFWSGLLATSLGASLTESLHGFAEIAGQQLAHASDGGVIATLDTGLAYLMTKSIQIDCAAYRGINRNSPNWSFAAGVSVRL